jgi:hypothetical protein
MIRSCAVDRKGIVDLGRNGQGGYQLRTHGGRVPIQWLIGTEGWGMYVQRPLGAFDLTGAEGKLTPFGDALPLDLFVTASADPTVILGEYARITGHAELPALWSGLRKPGAIPAEPANGTRANFTTPQSSRS